MSLTFDPATDCFIALLNLVDDGDKRIFVRKESANRSGIWPHCDPQLAETELKRLIKPIKPLIIYASNSLQVCILMIAAIRVTSLFTADSF